MVAQHRYAEATIAALLAERDGNSGGDSGYAAASSGNSGAAASSGCASNAITKGSGWREKCAIMVILAPWLSYTNIFDIQKYALNSSTFALLSGSLQDSF